MREFLPNNPGAPIPAMASRFHSGYHWRGVTDPERWADYAPSICSQSFTIQKSDKPNSPKKTRTTAGR